MKKSNPYHPGTFVRDSLRFLKGTPTWQTYLFMPVAYARFVWYSWRYRAPKHPNS